MGKDYQDINFSRIPTILKRYSFASKMAVCQEFSLNFTSRTRPSLKTLTTTILPHELEAFFAFSIMYEEYDNKDIRDNSRSMVWRILDAIDKESVKSVEQGHFGTGYNYMQAYFPSQSEIQSDARILFVRHLFYFSFKNDKINMLMEFFNKFDVEYKKLIALVHMIDCALNKDNTSEQKKVIEQHININDIISYCFSKGYLKEFSIDREEYIKDQQFTCANNLSDYITCVKLINQMPFIKFEDKLWLPFPHILKLTFSESLLHRLTDNNKELKDKFGKYVFEQYIFELFNDNNKYEKVVSELDIGKGKKTSDVLVFNNNRIVFIEAKTTFPRAKVRIYDNNAESFSKKLFSKSIMEVFNSIKSYCDKNNIDRNNCFGLLVFCENDTMSQKEKYEYLRKCNPHISSEDYNYIISHIKSIPLYECEELCYFSNQQIDTLLYEWSQDSNATYDGTRETKIIRDGIPRLFFKRYIDELNIARNEFLKELVVNDIVH